MERKFFALDDTRSLVAYSTRFICGNVLDLGAGTAKYRSIIEPRGTRYTACDAFPGPAIDVVTDIEHTPFADASFDAVYCTQVLEHVPRPWLAAQEIARLLRPGGVCVVSAPFLEAYHADPNDYFRYTVPGLESLFSEPVFELIESGGCGRLYSVLANYARRLYFDNYKKPRRFSWRFARLLTRAGQVLDRLCGNRIIYLNTYIIARRKS